MKRPWMTRRARVRGKTSIRLIGRRAGTQSAFRDEDEVLVPPQPRVDTSASACKICGRRSHEVGTHCSAPLTEIRCSCELEVFARQLDEDRWFDRRFAALLSQRLGYYRAQIVLESCVTFQQFERTHASWMIHGQLAVELDRHACVATRERLSARALSERLWELYRRRAHRGAIREILSRWFVSTVAAPGRAA